MFNKQTFLKLQSELHVWLTLSEVTTLTGISTRTIDKLCAAGALPFSRIGKKRIFLNADVRELLERDYNGPHRSGPRHDGQHDGSRQDRQQDPRHDGKDGSNEEGGEL